MAIGRLPGLVLSMFFASSPALAGSELQTHLDAFFDIQQRVYERPQIEQAPIVRVAFERHLSGAYDERELKRASDRELALLLRAADAMSFYTHASVDIARVERLLQLLERREAATDEERAMYFRGLIERRWFQTAAEYRKAHKGLDVEDVPTINEEPGGLTGVVTYEVSPTEFALAKRSRSLATGTHVVVVAHPLCRYSRDAMQALAADEAIAPVLASHAIWVAPISRWLYFDTLQAWNRDNPATQIVLADRREDWPFIRNWSTPMFYVVKDGQWIGALEGWPDAASRRPQLVALLRAAGLDAR